MSEREKMLAGAPYDVTDPELTAARLRARALCQRFNALPAHTHEDDRRALLQELTGAAADAYITPPFFCDYGAHIVFGRGVYFNFNCVILDCARVTIGNHVLFGPGVQIYTALHPMNADERRSGIESARPVVIGDDVWLGGGSIVCPGVSIGAGAVIGAGSVVTRDVPAGVFAAGNPCRVVRQL